VSGRSNQLSYLALCPP